MSRQELADSANAILATLYAAAGRTACHAGMTASYIGALERGEIHWPNKDYRQALRTLFNATDVELGFYIDRPENSNSAASDGFETGLRDPDATPSAPSRSWLEPLRRSMLLRSADTFADSSATELFRVVNAAHAAYQAARYRDALAHVPGLISSSEHHARSASGRQKQQAWRRLAHAYLLASKLAAKGGDGTLAWIAADRAATAASHLDQRTHPALQALAAYQASCALARMPGRANDAQAIISNAVDGLAACDEANTITLSVQGALFLQGAMIAASSGDRGEADKLLDAAARIATSLRTDRNELWTAFGPTNVEIHRVAVAVALRRPAFAIRSGERLDTERLPAVLIGRRAQVHIDLAAAYTQVGEGPTAVLHLLEAERIAPQALGHNTDVHTAIQALLQRENKARTPGLRSLAHRASLIAQ